MNLWKLEDVFNEENMVYDSMGEATNNRYAHAYHIKRYAQIPEDAFLNCTIEHGLNIVHDAVCTNEVSQHCSVILTYSDYRKEIIEKRTDLTAVPIGPYIAYVEGIYQENDIINLKKKYGKTLLVMPTHSAENNEVSYSSLDFLYIIDKVSKNYDTVLICLYYMDIKESVRKLYESRGYIVTSAGRCYDRFFLPRQKSLFDISDAVMGNDFTTAVAYAIYLNKPVYLCKQEVTIKGHITSNERLLERKTKYIDELYELCSDSLFCNLEKQKEWSKYVFGTDCVKSKEELRKILLPLIK